MLYWVNDMNCPRCNSDKTKYIMELFGAGWRYYCHNCKNIWLPVAPKWND